MPIDLQTTDPKSISSVTANPTEPANNGNEPVKPDSQTKSNGGDVPISEDTFFTGDVKNLPPQLRQAYDNMLRDYKSKTEKIASERKELETFKEKANLYEQISNDEEFVKYWKDLAQKGSAKSQPNEPESQGAELTDEEFVNALQNPKAFMKLFRKLNDQQIKSVESKVEEAHKKIDEAETMEIIDSFAKAKDKEGKLLHPDYEKLENLIIDGKTSLLGVFVSLDPTPATNNEQKIAKLERAYAKTKTFYESLVEEGKKVQMDSLTKKMRSSSEPPGIPAGNNDFAGDAKDLSVHDALRLAKKGITVTR